MTEKTKKAIATLHTEYEGTELDRIELEKISTVSIGTLIKYKAVQAVIHERFIPVSVAELVRLLNECANSDCYSCNWEYIEVDEKAYRVERTKMYRIL